MEKLTNEQKKAIKLVKLKKYREKVGNLMAYQIIERDKLHEYIGLEKEDKPLW